jgi:glycosyltransferase involved in cell wall biosynthesis
MKVLWFTNTPSLAAEKLGSKNIGGSWIEALETEINKVHDIQLGIVVKWDVPGDTNFCIGRTSYYIIKKPVQRNRLRRFVGRLYHKIESENIVESYLKAIRDFKPDVIHIFGTENSFGLIIEKIKIPCIIHIQGNLTMCDLKWFSGISYCELLKYSKKIKLLKGFGLFHEYYINKKEAERERRIFKACKFFMGRTDWDKRISLSLSPKSTYFHCDEIIRSEFYEQKWRREPVNSFTVISVFRKNIYKGLETILKCQSILKELNVGVEIKWKIAGLEYFDEIVYITERKLRDTINNNNIFLLGRLNAQKLVDEMLNADLFVHTSHIDNSPNSVCEAMLLGMPIIATYSGGIPSLIRDKVDGLLVQNGDPYALAGAIIEIFKNCEYAVELGKNARNHALSRHNKSHIVNDLLGIYRTIKS